MTPSGVDDRVVETWVRVAEDDALNARAALKHQDGTPAQVCFLSQQMAEKWLKAALVHYTGDYPKTHLLDALAKLLEPHLPSLVSDQKEDFIEVSRYYVTARYPAEVPLESFTWERAEEAFAAAQRIAETIRKAIGKM